MPTTAPERAAPDGAPPGAPAESSFHGELSEGPLLPEPARAAPGTTPSAAPRYRPGGELGRGGMGRVHAAFDTTLHREVAVKEAREAGEGAERHLLREARITACLDHPGVIAVLDAGRDERGRAYYAMRVVRGESLAAAVARAPRLSDRLPLVRSLLQAAHALAHAHERGIVHRDLSAANVRLGARGEVVVMDWGLAATVEEAGRGGVVCGTDGFRPPELRRGESASPASDVWSLGALLRLVLVGHREAAAAGRVPALPRRAPPELRSILARAMAPSPAARYGDAGAFAADLAAYLDGAPVAAHRERPWQRLARFGRRRPAALLAIVGATAAVAVVSAVLGLFAAAAEREARAARAEAQGIARELVRERLGEAIVADDGARAAALATQARGLGDGAVAAGAGAAFALAPPVSVAPAVSDPRCRTFDVAPSGDRLCARDGALWRGDPLVALPSPGLGPPWAARALPDGGHAALWGASPPLVLTGHAADGSEVAREPLPGGAATFAVGAVSAWVAVPSALVRVDPGGGLARVSSPCPFPTPIRAVAALPGGAWIVCGDGTAAGPASDERQPAPELFAALPAVSAAVALGADQVAVGSRDGAVGVYAIAARRVLRVDASVVGPVERLEPGPRPGEVVVVGAGGVGLWRASTGTWLHHEATGRAVDARAVPGGVRSWGEAGDLLWRVASPGAPHRLVTSGGVAALAFAPAGDVLAVGAGDGGVHLVDLGAGDVRHLFGPHHVVKGFAFSRDGAELAVVAAGAPGLEVLRVADLSRVAGAWEGDTEVFPNRVARLGADRVLTFPYGEAPRVFDRRTGERVPTPPITEHGVRDVASPADHRFALALLPDGGRLVRLDDGGATELEASPGARRLAVSGDGRWLALMERAAVVTRPLAGQSARGAPRLALPGARLEIVALDHLGDRVAVGRLDGGVEVYAVEGGAEIVTLRAHRLRVAALAFSPDGRLLATGGWDATTRLLALPDPL